MRYLFMVKNHYLIKKVLLCLFVVSTVYSLNKGIMAGAQSIDTRFICPIPGGIENNLFTISNYVDQDPQAGSILDYNCGKFTYDGHEGTDFDLVDFYCMDEGYPVICAASGTVYSVVDGEPDRHSNLDRNEKSNMVVIIHSDNSVASYLHFRKNSIRVKPRQRVNIGDTLGLIGSSGYSSGPHLHFEVSDSRDNIIDPFKGSCGENVSLWKEQQFRYSMERRTEALTHGLTTLSLSKAMINERPPSRKHFSAGDTIKSWVNMRNIKAGDVLTWIFNMPNGNDFKDSHTITESYSSSWSYTWYCPFQSSPYYGKWKVNVYCNDTLIAIDSCTYDTKPNELPVIESTNFKIKINSTLSDTFVGLDNDGSIFWHRLKTPPRHGTVTLHGGRRRKFTYIPDKNFTGTDTFFVYAVDDVNVSGKESPITVEVHSTNDSRISIHKRRTLSGQEQYSERTIIYYDITGKVIKKKLQSENALSPDMQPLLPTGRIILFQSRENNKARSGRIITLP